MYENTYTHMHLQLQTLQNVAMNCPIQHAVCLARTILSVGVAYSCICRGKKGSANVVALVMAKTAAKRKTPPSDDTRSQHSFSLERHCESQASQPVGFLFVGAEIFVLLGTFPVCGHKGFVAKFINIQAFWITCRAHHSSRGPASNCRYITHSNYIMFAGLFIFFHVKLLIQLYANIYVLCLSSRLASMGFLANDARLTPRDRDMRIFIQI